MRKEDIRDLLESVINGTPPDARYMRYIDVGTQSFLDFFSREVLDALIMQGGATCRFFEGPYGSGKTHLLQLLYGLGIQRQMLVSQIELSSATGLRDWNVITSFILQNLQTTITGSLVKGLPEMLAALGEKGKINVRRLKGIPYAHTGFANAMEKVTCAYSLKENQRDLLFRYLRGERISATQLKEVGIQGVKNPLTKRNAELILNTVLSGLYQLGLPVLLLVDETETALGSRYSTKNQLAANLIRRLVDGCSRGTIVGSAITFTVLPGFLENCARTYPAVGERLLPPSSINGDAPWRWPVLSIEKVSTTQGMDIFAEECSRKFEQLILLGGGNAEGIREELKNAGREVLRHNAGISVRRDLIKRFASISLRRIK